MSRWNSVSVTPGIVCGTCRERRRCPSPERPCPRAGCPSTRARSRRCRTAGPPRAPGSAPGCDLYCSDWTNSSPGDSRWRITMSRAPLPLKRQALVLLAFPLAVLASLLLGLDRAFDFLLTVSRSLIALKWTAICSFSSGSPPGSPLARSRIALARLALFLKRACDPLELAVAPTHRCVLLGSAAGPARRHSCLRRGSCVATSALSGSSSRVASTSSGERLCASASAFIDRIRVSKFIGAGVIVISNTSRPQSFADLLVLDLLLLGGQITEADAGGIVPPISRQASREFAELLKVESALDVEPFFGFAHRPRGRPADDLLGVSLMVPVQRNLLAGVLPAADCVLEGAGDDPIPATIDRIGSRKR